MGCDPAVLHEPGVTVKGSERRAENRVTAGYAVGNHFIVTCDPAAESMLSSAIAEATMEPTLEAWAKVAEAQSGESLGGGRMQLFPGDSFPQEPLADGYTLRTLDRSNDDDVALITRLVERSDEDDLDEAEIELDNLDAIIEVVVDADGEIASYASSHDFDMAVGFGDIGIMTRPDCRGLGLGSVAVATVCRSIRAAGDEPLYRCDEENVGSIALSQSMGFTIATQLSGYRFSV